MIDIPTLITKLRSAPQRAGTFDRGDPKPLDEYRVVLTGKERDWLVSELEEHSRENHDDQQCCESCGIFSPIEEMVSMADCWFCSECTDEFQKTFDACDHKWSESKDEMGDDGQYCERCSGFVRNEDFSAMFPADERLKRPSGEG